MMYKDFNTGEIFSEDEVKELFEQFKYEIYTEADMPTFEAYLEDRLSMGRQGVGGLVEAPWYAVMKDADDTDWGYGSYDLDEAKEMARNCGDEAYIAVIREGDDPVCIEELRQEDFE